MGDEPLSLRQADDSTLPYIETLLAKNDLPSQDVRSKPECFYVGYDGDDRIGIGGLEMDGTDALLRSVVVERSARENGLGTALCEALEDTAKADGVETLYLLTTTAAEFFGDRGYTEIDRTAVPPAIQRTTEFDDLCPSTATCLQKRLE
ncbi:arsenic resistance N-acetyltransferase ArsN2 [Natrinema ejinorense]|uniref:GNAT family N-acetyltransferase n=1 Tax=Natrinema ejinorense TaxID=373386 RepID=A0A2A5QPX8_9EURY|nr:arsenic resistance N-acetyltransferase ArsN2 [Natrinema ejinorense]PCR88803.1 GNAT family N-acetyltransferase [Natrinema ejinorense]